MSYVEFSLIIFTFEILCVVDIIICVLMSFLELILLYIGWVLKYKCVEEETNWI